MKILLITVLSVIALIVVGALVAYGMGSRMPVNHSTTVTGIVDAPPAKVFARISDVAHGAEWRKQVKSVQMLATEPGHEKWIEDLGSGVKMNFTVTGVDPITPDGHATRKVLLEDASYGGTWTYVVSPGPTDGTTALSITEDGYINPPIYRFVMAYVFGPTKNLDQYMSDIKAASK